MNYIVSFENGIKTFSFNQPKKKNPVGIDAFEGLLACLAESQQDGTKVLVLKGEGGNFCAGADLTAGMADSRFADVANFLRNYANPTILGLRKAPFPVIAQVQGVCVGIGFSLALACDMVLADKTAVFSQIFAKIGLATDGGSGYLLPKTVGYHKAFEIATSASMILAEEAQKLGLVNHLFENQEELNTQVSQIAQYFVTAPSVAIAAIKENLNEGFIEHLAATLEKEAVNQGKCFQTQDFMEGVTAFFEKRKANFTGK
jgi:2-(1,2-epoxy-1,2-dihydrophenyl)acetyl-CoA isomerase